MTITLTEAQVRSIEHEAETIGRLDEYRQLVEAGQSPRMALMLVARQFPGLNGTDAKFNKLERQRMSEMEAEDRDSIVKIARKAGINTHGKTYNGALGRYNDPGAWVSGTSDVRQTAKVKGLSLRGQVNVENHKPATKASKLSKRMVAEYEQAYCDRDPGLQEKVSKSPKARQDLREMIIEKHANKKSKE